MSRNPDHHSETRMSPKDRREWSLATGRDIQSKQDLARYEKESGNAIVDKNFKPKPPADISDDEVGKMIEQHRSERFSSEIDERVKLKPLADCVIIEPKVDEKVSDTIIIPDQAKEKSTRGRVIAVGPGRWMPELERHEAIDLEVGDEVIFQQYSGTEIEVKGSRCWMVKESDVLVALEK
jgi:chaperonin GroES